MVDVWGGGYRRSIWRRSCDDLTEGTAGGKERGTNGGGNEAET